MALAELRLYIEQQLEHLNEEQLKQVMAFLEEISSEQRVDQDFLGHALRIMDERKEVLQKLAQ